MNYISIRGFSQSTNCLNKLFKITRYTKPVDKTVYKAGDHVKGVKIPFIKKQYPEYDYETRFFKRQNRGLYGGAQITSSHTCSESGNKNLRTHKPNIVRTKLWSETLNKLIQLRVSTKVLRTITKEGGLDNYLLKDKPARVKTIGLTGWRLKYDILKTHDLKQLKQHDNQQVFHIDKSGRKFIVGKNKLIKDLFPLVQRDSYYPITYKQFLANHTWLTFDEVIEKLEGYGYDFQQACI